MTVPFYGHVKQYHNIQLEIDANLHEVQHISTSRSRRDDIAGTTHRRREFPPFEQRSGPRKRFTRARASSAGGDYNLNSDAVDFHGTPRLKARLSQTMEGWKRWAFKPVDPFFAKDGAGTPARAGGAKLCLAEVRTGPREHGGEINPTASLR